MITVLHVTESKFHDFPYCLEIVLLLWSNLDFFIHMLRISGYRSDPYRESVFSFCVEHCVPERILLLSVP